MLYDLCPHHYRLSMRAMRLRAIARNTIPVLCILGLYIPVVTIAFGYAPLPALASIAASAVLYLAYRRAVRRWPAADRLLAARITYCPRCNRVPGDEAAA